MDLYRPYMGYNNIISDMTLVPLIFLVFLLLLHTLHVSCHNDVPYTLHSSGLEIASRMSDSVLPLSTTFPLVFIFFHCFCNVTLRYHYINLQFYKFRDSSYYHVLGYQIVLCYDTLLLSML